jgi:transcriptional regulator with XRE-family HTH domain
MTDLPAAIRKAMGAMTQADLARRCQVSCPTVTNWLNGKRTPNYRRLQDIADACNVPILRLVTAAVATGRRAHREKGAA